MLEADSSLFNLNLTVLHCGGVEAAVFRLFHFDSYGESVDFQLLSSLALSLRDHVNYTLLVSTARY